MSKENSFSAKAIRAGYDSSEHFNSVNPPIYQTASFDLQDIDRTRRLWTGAEAGGIYSRVGNPTAGILEARIAELEGGKAAVALSSGMAAITYTLLLLGQGGGNIVSGSSLYGAAMLSLIKFLPKYGITTKFVEDRDDPEAYDPERCRRYDHLLRRLPGSFHHDDVLHELHRSRPCCSDT